MPLLKQSIKSYLTFQEPKDTYEFLLKENTNENIDNESKPQVNINGNIYNNTESVNGQNKRQNSNSNIKRMVSYNLPQNKQYLSQRLFLPENNDAKIREFEITVVNEVLDGFICFYDDMIDKKVLNDNVLEPLMLLSNLNIKYKNFDTASYIKNHLIVHNQIKEIRDFDKIIDEVNFGSCAIFIEGINSAFVVDVKGFSHRVVEKPVNEMVIRGPQEGFNELITINISLIRKRINDEHLIQESISIGKRSKTKCAMLYIKDIANEELVNEIRRRLKSINIDFLNDSGELEQLIEDSTYSTAPQVLATERPDRTAAMLVEGRVAVIVNGSPIVLVMPVNFNDLVHSVEDKNLRYMSGNLLRYVRLFAIFSALLLPGFYIAITNFHQEMIPTSLLLAIESAREKVPFPSIFELIALEISFELIREAGIRVPGPIGPTLGIIGALILGQAAVAANIVSPILIIVVAVTGIGSFAIPDFSLALSFRIMRFVYIIFGAAAGFLGITTVAFMHGIWLAATKSFGMPFLVPFAPKTKTQSNNDIFRAPIWKQEKRPDYLNTKVEKKQPKISRGWTQARNKEDKGGEK